MGMHRTVWKKIGGQLEFLIEIDINGGKGYYEICLMSTEEENGLISYQHAVQSFQVAPAREARVGVH